MDKLKQIIRETIVEVMDNDGGKFDPPGLNPAVVKLFEDINEDFYQSTLDDGYWKEISKLFPDYNGKESDTQKAVSYILKGMKNKYPDQDWANIEADMRSKVHAGLT
jgi:tryptophan synthase beta subunit